MSKGPPPRHTETTGTIEWKIVNLTEGRRKRERERGRNKGGIREVKGWVG